MNVFDKHQLKIARSTLKMSDVGARITGGMPKEEAREVVLKLTGRIPKEPGLKWNLPNEWRESDSWVNKPK